MIILLTLVLLVIVLALPAAGIILAGHNQHTAENEDP
jgi:hypothetical protein